MKILKTLILLAVIAGVIGYFRGWFTFSKSGDSTYSVSVDKDKLRDDVGKATDKAKDLADGVKDRIDGLQSVTGRVVGLDILSSSLRVKPASGDEVLVKWTGSGTNTVDLAVLTALGTGDEVTVEYENENGVNVLKKIVKK